MSSLAEFRESLGRINAELNSSTNRVLENIVRRELNSNSTGQKKEQSYDVFEIAIRVAGSNDIITKKEQAIIDKLYTTKNKTDRSDALRTAYKVANSDGKIDQDETKVINKIFFTEDDN